MAKERLVIIDDDVSLVAWLTLQLEEVGYSVIANFSSAEKALSVLPELTPDLVLLDIVLEGDIGGLEAAEILLSQFHVPVIILTADDDEADFQQAKQLGVYHYLVKPLRPREIQVAVELTLSLFRSDREVKQLLEDRKALAKGLSLEINRMTTFIMAVTKVREMDRLMLSEEFYDWHEIFQVYLRDLQELTGSSYAALGHFDQQGRLQEVVSSDDDPLHKKLLNQLFKRYQQREPMIVNDQAELKQLGCWGFLEPIKGLLCQRILIKGSLPSFLYMANKTIGSEYSDLDVEIVSFYANELEKIISRQQLVNSLMEKNRELEENEIRLVNQHSILAELMGGDVQSCGELQEEILKLTQVVSQALNVDQVVLWMFDEMNGLPSTRWHYCLETGQKSFTGMLQKGEYPAGLNRSLFGQVLAFSDVNESGELAPLIESYYHPSGIRAAMYVPIWKEATTVGVIAIEQIGETRQWHVDEHYFVTALSEIISNHMLQCERSQVQYELGRSLAQLQEAQQQLLQSEKMASIGQLAAGVAHEINNPVGYINSNISSLRGYIDDLFQVIDIYQQKKSLLPETVKQQLEEKEQQLDLNYLRGDIQDLLGESLEGVSRVKQIVKDLKDFSHVDEEEWQEANLHDGIDSTLNIVWNELKYKAEVLKQYGSIPDINCIPSQLNQVFMNLLVNAAHAIEERGTITIATGSEGSEWVWIKVTDTGVGISEEHRNRIFDPFFTTKPVGKGTGLGLSLSFSIIERHQGRIEIDSELGKGTSFTIRLPVKVAAGDAVALGG